MLESILPSLPSPKWPSTVGLFAFALLYGAGCAGRAPAPEATPSKPPGQTVSMEAKQVAVEEEATAVAEIHFEKGQSKLSAAARSKIAALLSEKRKSPIEEIKVVTWADQEYPSVHTKTLSSRAVGLARRRNEEIEVFLRRNGIKKVEAFNMAERPGMLSSWLDTDNAKIKKALEISGIPNTDSSVKRPSQASKSILLVVETH